MLAFSQMSNNDKPEPQTPIQAQASQGIPASKQTQNPYLTSFYKGKEEMLQRSQQIAENLKESGLDKLEDFTYLGQKKYFEVQLWQAKQRAFLYTLATFGVGAAIGFGTKRMFKIPNTMAFGAGFFSTAYLWISISWNKIEVWSHYRGKLEELEDWKDKRPNKVTSRGVGPAMKEAPVFPSVESEKNLGPRRLTPADPNAPKAPEEPKSRMSQFLSKMKDMKDNISNRGDDSGKK